MLPNWTWAAANPFDLDEATFLALYAGLIVLSVTVAWLLQDTARTTDRRPDLRDLGEVELAYLFGGARRTVDTLYLALASRGAASVEGTKIVVRGDTAAALPPHLEDFRETLVGTYSHRRFVQRVHGAVPYEAVLARLLTRKVMLPPARRRALKAATWGPGGLLLVFGVVKVLVGVTRAEPTGWLIVSVSVVFVTVVVSLRRERYLTGETLASLAALRDSRGRSPRASLPEEVAFAFALTGTSALEGTTHADYAVVAVPQGGGGRRRR